MGSGTESVENAVGVKAIIGFIVAIICLMVGSDVFHVHHEHELHVHEQEWADRISEKKKEMSQWQLENLDLVIPEIVLQEFESKSDTEKQQFLGPLNSIDQWQSASYFAHNTFIYSLNGDRLGNCTTEDFIECRISCLSDANCGAWFHSGDFCGLYPVAKNLISKSRNGTVSGIERSAFV